MARRTKIIVIDEPDIVDSLKDLHKQATTERSHYYVAKCCLDAINEIERLRDLLNDMQYIDMRARYARGEKSWANMINEREALAWPR